jgi:tRNA pseudouridine55 synthase
MVSGWIILDKPDGITSASAVAQVKHAIKRVTGIIPKIGHTGTLDPFATGVLPLALGESTKLCQFLINHDKSYQLEIHWGSFYNTGDYTGIPTHTGGYIPTFGQIQDILPLFISDIMQVPHQFSAIKKDGKRAYDLARAGTAFTLDARPITIYGLNILSHNNDKTILNVDCSKGTYVRVLAEDIAKKLGTYAHLSALRRTKVGHFSVDDAITLDNDDEIFYKKMLLPQNGLDGIPAMTITGQHQGKIRLGQSLFYSEAEFGKIPECDRFILKYQDKIVAIAGFEQGLIRPKRVFNL